MYFSKKTSSSNSIIGFAITCFSCKLHIGLINFKLRHICVFSIKKLMKSKENLVFLGMMGSGKSSIGSLVARKLKLDFIDVDKEIEKELGLTISKIFDIKGEDYFRKYEEKITLKILKFNAVVVSLGGGAFVNKIIRKEILKNHISFWLNWNNEILLNRIKNSKKRPLAFNSTENELIDLIKKRSNIYSKALYEIKCDKMSKSEIVKKVLKNYEIH